MLLSGYPVLLQNFAFCCGIRKTLLIRFLNRGFLQYLLLLGRMSRTMFFFVKELLGLFKALVKGLFGEFSQDSHNLKFSGEKINLRGGGFPAQAFAPSRNPASPPGLFSIARRHFPAYAAQREGLPCPAVA